MCRKIKSQRGLTLIELIVFIVVISVGLTGILAVYNTVVMGSGDPMTRKQALAIAESLLLEIGQQPFTWCDPQDPNAGLATQAADCTTSQTLKTGPSPPTETRGGSDPFDNVADYNGYNGPASDIAGHTSPNLAGYNLVVTITQAGGTAAFPGLPTDAVLRIEVSVTGHKETVRLVGYRTRYAPKG
jgi:MSHA pilin protein MshD